jgi:hypothetical protein
MGTKFVTGLASGGPGDAISLVLVASKKPIVIAIQLGHISIFFPLTITKSEANIVYKINRKSAFEVWKQCAGDDANKLQNGSEGLLKFVTCYGAELYSGGENNRY